MFGQEFAKSLETRKSGMMETCTNHAAPMPILIYQGKMPAL